MGYKFSLVLNREVSAEESAVLRAAGCDNAVFTTDVHPTNTEITVTKLEFDDTTSQTLAAAIEQALEAVKNVDVPDLKVPGLTVPAQPAGPVTDDPSAVAGEVVDEPAAQPGGSVDSDAAPASAVEAGEAATAAATTSGARKKPARKSAAKANPKKDSSAATVSGS
jgi:ParB-like chromosome segregation protein Spo0J